MNFTYYKQSPLNYTGAIGVTLIACFLSLMWAAINYLEIRKIILISSQNDNQSQVAINSISNNLYQISAKTFEGTKQFIKQQYLISLIFVFFIFWLIFGALELGKHAYVAFAFLFGALISLFCNIMAILIASYTNTRVAHQSNVDIQSAFVIALRGGLTVGFSFTSLALGCLLFLFMAYIKLMNINPEMSLQGNQIGFLFKCISGYGLGSSTISLFSRIGGSLYSKSTDLGINLLGKVKSKIKNQQFQQIIQIVDNISDNIGDIAGVSSDLFSSLSQAICAALVISSNSIIGIDKNGIILNTINLSNIMSPFIIISFGLIACIIVTIIGIHLVKIQEEKNIENTCRYLIISISIISYGFLYLSCWLTFPTNFYLIESSKKIVLAPWAPYICTILGLSSGIIIYYFTSLFTNYNYSIIKKSANSCNDGNTMSMIYGLSLSYISTFFPVVCISLTIYGSCTILGFYGVSLAALGMLSNIPIYLSLNTYRSICQNANRITKIMKSPQDVLMITQTLIIGGNINAVGKGFSIAAGILVAVSLFGAFLSISNLDSISINLQQPTIYAGLLLGGLLPYLFCGFVLKSLKKITLVMFQGVKDAMNKRRQAQQQQMKLQNSFIKLTTRSSFIEMIIPILIIYVFPLAIGIIFGPQILAGVMPGSIISGIQIGVFTSNAGQIWNNTKNYIQDQKLKKQDGTIAKKGDQIHRISCINDKIGSCLKDLNGPSINIIVKLLANISLVFCPLYLYIQSIRR